MKNFIKIGIVVVSAVAIFGFTESANAYFYQMRYPTPQYAPTYYQTPYQFFNYVPPGYDDVSRLVQGTLNWVSYYQYVPAPTRYYFYNPAPAYTYPMYWW